MFQKAGGIYFTGITALIFRGKTYIISNIQPYHIFFYLRNEKRTVIITQICFIESENGENIILEQLGIIV